MTVSFVFLVVVGVVLGDGVGVVVDGVCSS